MADAGYGRSVSFRLALEKRGWSYVMAVDPKEIARPSTAEPYQPAYGGLGPPTLPRYRETAHPQHGLGLDHFEGRTWRGWHHHGRPEETEPNEALLGPVRRFRSYESNAADARARPRVCDRIRRTGPGSC
ncbi:transposase, partial [Streptomyces diastatochromogenes]|uniref:transposase n=1 Tax=Streptomyces diastatochromogenes TaxID=42236 RepID=UPI0036864147